MSTRERKVSQLDVLAMNLLFEGDMKMAENGYEYRKGKSVEDVARARQKASKFGRGKLETEISLMAAYLSSIVKRVR